MPRNPKYREPWGDACAWPRDDDPAPRRDDTPTGAANTADAKRVRTDPALNEAAAHRAQRERANRQQGRTSGGRRL